MFRDRVDGATQLVDLVRCHDMEPDVVLAIPRGGVEVGRVVADALGLPLDVVVVRKLGAPDNPELAIGAVTGDGGVWLNDAMIDSLGVDDTYVDAELARQREAARERLEAYRAVGEGVDLTDRTAFIVDDGLATGATMFAAVQAVREAGARAVYVGVPVASPNAVARLEAVADGVLVVEAPPHFMSVGQFFRRFDQVDDARARELLTGAVAEL
ncbi:phosphoribosyltransferase [Natronomonas sp. EA1]|uniref:phosphoribosyltransferase n=1 Tax=Natronomonas sp. EA1 TaxID=3421655 RepID=UPI003EC03735